jgi:hypothetical protein
MAAPKWRPWWERVEDYYGFDDTRKEFVRGATTVGFRPNNRQEAMVAQLAAGYIRNVFPSVASHSGKGSPDGHS